MSTTRQWRNLVVTVVLTSAAIVGCAQPGAAALPTPQATAGCGAEIPAVKCNSALYSPPAGLGSPAPPPSATDVEPAQIPCGGGFFDAATASSLRAHFGFMQCFRIDGASKWIVFADGMDQTTGGASVGGSIVATTSCASSACADGNTAHDFAGFQVFYGPGSNGGRSDLQASFGTNLLWISSGSCGLFTFDVDTGAWYGHDESTITALLAGRAPASTAVPVPAPLTGAAALASSAPQATEVCAP